MLKHFEKFILYNRDSLASKGLISVLKIKTGNDYGNVLITLSQAEIYRRNTQIQNNVIAKQIEKFIIMSVCPR